MLPYKNPELIEIENKLIPNDAKHDYYKGVFAQLRKTESPIFNSNAFTWHFSWLIYRKCNIGWIMMLVSAGAFAFGLIPGLIVYLILNLIIAFFGNGMYHGVIKKRAEMALNFEGEDREAFINRHRTTDMGMTIFGGTIFFVLMTVAFIVAFARG